MTVYMIWDSQSQKYVSLASKHRKHYCTKQNALNAINNSEFPNKDELRKRYEGENQIKCN